MTHTYYGYKHQLKAGKWVPADPLPLESNHAQQITAARPGGLRDWLRSFGNGRV